MILLCTLPLAAESPPTFHQVLNQARMQNHGLETFQVNLNMQFLLAGMRIPAGGVLYFQHPDKIRLKVNNLPRSLRNRRGFFRSMIPTSFNPDDYKGRIAGEEILDGKIHCTILEMIPRGDSPISRARVWVNRERNVSPKSEIFYESGGVIRTLVNFRRESDFILPDRQFVELDFPGFSTRARIEYGQYRINIPLPGGIFDCDDDSTDPKD